MNTFEDDEFEDIISKANEEMFGSWLSQGIEMGWVTEPFCNTHDGDPFMTDEEQQEWEDGGDPCQMVLKLKI